MSVSKAEGILFALGAIGCAETNSCVSLPGRGPFIGVGWYLLCRNGSLCLSPSRLGHLRSLCCQLLARMIVERDQPS